MSFMQEYSQRYQDLLTYWCLMLASSNFVLRTSQQPKSKINAAAKIKLDSKSASKVFSFSFVARWGLIVNNFHLFLFLITISHRIAFVEHSSISCYSKDLLALHRWTAFAAGSGFWIHHDERSRWRGGCYQCSIQPHVRHCWTRR